MISFQYPILNAFSLCLRLLRIPHSCQYLALRYCGLTALEFLFFYSSFLPLPRPPFFFIQLPPLLVRCQGQLVLLGSSTFSLLRAEGLTRPPPCLQTLPRCQGLLPEVSLKQLNVLAHKPEVSAENQTPTCHRFCLRPSATRLLLSLHLAYPHGFFFIVLTSVPTEVEVFSDRPLPHQTSSDPPQLSRINGPTSLM